MQQKDRKMTEKTKKSSRTPQKEETIQKTRKKMKQKERKMTKKTKLRMMARGE